MSGRIEERTYESGVTVYRVRLVRKGVRRYSLTFEDLDSAVQWLDENEEAYFADPDAFLAKQRDIFLFMRRNMLRSMNGMIRPRGR